MNTVIKKGKEISKGAIIVLIDGTELKVIDTSPGMAIIEHEGQKRKGVRAEFNDGTWSLIHPEDDFKVKC